MKPRKSISKLHLALIFQVAAVIFFVVTVLLNLVFSQNVAPLYFRMINEDRESIITYLNNIKTLPVFPQEFLRYKNSYGQPIDEGVFKIDRERGKEIGRLEGVLMKNPNSRDILLQLSVLYKEKGDVQKAQEYLQKVKQLDPGI